MTVGRGFLPGGVRGDEGRGRQAGDGCMRVWTAVWGRLGGGNLRGTRREAKPLFWGVDGCCLCVCVCVLFWRVEHGIRSEAKPLLGVA